MCNLQNIRHGYGFIYIHHYELYERKSSSLMKKIFYLKFIFERINNFNKLHYMKI